MPQVKIIAAAAVFAALIGQASAAVPYPDWWMTSSDGGAFAACERVGPAAPGVDPDPGRSMTISADPNKADFLRYTVHNFGPTGDVEFVRVHFPERVNLFAYTEQKEACEAIRSGAITIERLDAGEGREECPPGVVTATCEVRPKAGTHECPAGYRWVAGVGCNDD